MVTGVKKLYRYFHKRLSFVQAFSLLSFMILLFSLPLTISILQTSQDIRQRASYSNVKNGVLIEYLQVTATAISPTQINISFNPASESDVVIYHVFRDGLFIAAINTTSLGDTGLTPGTTYSYTVRALDSLGTVYGESTSISATTWTLPSE